MINITEKVKDAGSGTEEIGELCMACGKDFATIHRTMVGVRVKNIQ